MKTPAQDFTSRMALQTAKHLGQLVRDARLARRMTQRELAERARSSEPTVRRLEKGGAAVAMGTWLSVMEHVGLLPLLNTLRDERTEALLAERKVKRTRRSTPDDMEF